MRIIDTSNLDTSAYAICACCGREIYLGECAYTYIDSLSLKTYIFCSEDCFMDSVADIMELTRETAKENGIEIHSTKTKITELKKEISKLEIDLLVKKGELDCLTNNTKLML